MPTNSGFYSLPKLSHENRKLKTQITKEEVASVMKTFKTKKIPGPEGFTAKFHQTFQEELILVVLK